ncbi:MAG: HAMP domain-containing histidine kinase, partial [Chloroflexi bacterium]|nr:HAMP domain-containing histidine kinase [Chloroflexota bacterium]
MRPGITRLITAAVADPDDARRRRLLNVLLIATLCCTLVGLFVTIAAQWAEPGDADGWGAMYAAIMATLIVCVGIMGLAHVKLPGAGHLASVLYLLWLLMLAPATDSPAQVVAGRSLFWFVLPILAAPFLQRPGASFVLFAVSCAVTLAVAYSKQIPIVPNLFGLLVVFAIALVAWLAARGLEDALGDVRRQEALRLAAERARADALAQQVIVLEQRVQEQTEALAASNRQQIEFLHAVSHEMHSPLQGAMLCCEILQRSPDLPAEQQGQVEQIDFTLERLQRLLSDILDTAWLGHGAIVPDVQDIPNLGALVRDALRVLQPQIDEAGLVVQVDVPAWRLRGDPEQLARVLLNLLSNAVKYSRPGGPVACVASVDDDQFHLRVTDTGIG